jgi:hypothetical protein
MGTLATAAAKTKAHKLRQRLGFNTFCSHQHNDFSPVGPFLSVVVDGVGAGS